MSPEKLGAMVGPEGRQMSAFEVLWSYFTHTAHHRGQAEVYLRVKGIKPPDLRVLEPDFLLQCGRTAYTGS